MEKERHQKTIDSKIDLEEVKNIALPFHFAMHFAITGICRELLNSMDLVLGCAWQKEKKKKSTVG